MSNNPELDRDIETIKRTADAQAGRPRSIADAETRPATDLPTDPLPGEVCTCPSLAVLDPNCPTHGTAKALSVEYGDRLPDDEVAAANQRDFGAWLDPNHPDAPKYTHAEIGPVTPLNQQIIGLLSPTTSQRARQIATTAADLIDGDRNAAYGDATEQFGETGQLWSVVLGVDVSAEQVAICMALVKIARLNNDIAHADSWVDAVGYLALGGGIANAPGRHRKPE
ncbi:hypothetical protein I5G59_gp54 [Mycobacterium phage LilMcDreamy]|uniref:DUF6378 domain-containing protein n=1 Tax=Mycobacterium phage LilMcDreamy TaxID=2652422 RepID=A0A5P8D6M2_9CAUD|nr:hypothetical protein I5G59_gp54 [Mycobacterium phage LilMcDreamy]QFP94674.1 hypothetical protein SEA_LILMCDREAMY_54 [Mycobacterium phage LilMcDreamy]